MSLSSGEKAATQKRKSSQTRIASISTMIIKRLDRCRLHEMVVYPLCIYCNIIIIDRKCPICMQNRKGKSVLFIPLLS